MSCLNHCSRVRWHVHAWENLRGISFSTQSVHWLSYRLVYVISDYRKHIVTSSFSNMFPLAYKYDIWVFDTWFVLYALCIFINLAIIPNCYLLFQVFSDSSHHGWINTSHDSYGDILVFLDGSFGAWLVNLSSLTTLKALPSCLFVKF